MEFIEEYYRENYDTLVSKVAGRVGGRGNAEDVVQEAFTRALKYKRAYRKGMSVGAWFSTILNNATRDFKREERNRGMSVEVKEHTLGSYELPDGITLSDYTKGKSAIHKRILSLFFVDEFKPLEIASMLDIKPGQVYMTIHRFKKEVRGSSDAS
jgi:RNA polymerase sigma-70 factor (ECF subfamily)